MYLKRTILIILVITLSLWVAGCGKKTQIESNGAVEIQATLTSEVVDASEIGSIQVSLTKGNMTITETLTSSADGETASCTVNGLAPGTWTVLVQVFDLVNNATASWTGSVIIKAGQTEDVHITPELITGSLTVGVSIPTDFEFGLTLGKRWVWKTTVEGIPGEMYQSMWINGSANVEGKPALTAKLTYDALNVAVNMPLYREGSAPYYWYYLGAPGWGIGLNEYRNNTALFTSPIAVGKESYLDLVVVDEREVTVPAGTYNTWYLEKESTKIECSIDATPCPVGEVVTTKEEAWISPTDGIIKTVTTSNSVSIPSGFSLGDTVTTMELVSTEIIPVPSAATGLLASMLWFSDSLG
ncbi:MAG TPA: hypothetical protein GXX29_02685 [Firmicutes bacterium]|nr:hypothetical protein [Bacillota bacterium]